MIIEVNIIVFVLILILFIVIMGKYYEQKLINRYIIKEMQLVEKIRRANLFISKRQTNLNLYDFQLYNLDSALIEQDDVIF